MTGRTVIIAQARMSSTRLPGKTLMDLGGKPVIDHVLRRAGRAKLVDDVWVATTIDSSDDILVEHLNNLGVRYVRGSLDDVLARYVLAAEASHADTIVRITCDCPLIDPEVIGVVVAQYREAAKVDYCSNTLLRTYPIGMDTEVFSRAALERAHREAAQPHEREHVTPYIYQHPELFQLRNVSDAVFADWADMRLTVDEATDLEFVHALMARAGVDASVQDIIDAVEMDSTLTTINADVSHRHMWKPLAR